MIAQVYIWMIMRWGLNHDLSYDSESGNEEGDRSSEADF